jgi:hypothetical protein
VLKRIFGPKRDQIIEEWRKLHNEEPKDLCFSPTLVWVIKSRIMRWAGHVDIRGKGEVSTGFWWGNMRERDPLEDLSVDGMIILNGC